MRSRHLTGTRVQYRTGYIYVKTSEGMKPESRRIWEETYGELMSGDRIFHMDGDRQNNDISNLAKVHFNDVKFTMLKESRVLWVPKVRNDVSKNSGVVVRNKRPIALSRAG